MAVNGWQQDNRYKAETYLSTERLDAPPGDAGKLLSAEVSYLRELVREEFRRQGYDQAEARGLVRITILINRPDESTDDNEHTVQAG